MKSVELKNRHRYTQQMMFIDSVLDAPGDVHGFSQRRMGNCSRMVSGWYRAKFMDRVRVTLGDVLDGV